MHPIEFRKFSKGFTLLEIIIVLVILSILATMGLGILSAQKANTAYVVANNNFEKIFEAVKTSIEHNHMLPCPDIDYVNPDGTGNNNRSTANDLTTECSSFFGLVPYVDLNIKREDALDGWDNYIFYHISNGASRDEQWSTRNSIISTSSGLMSVDDGESNTLSDNSVLILLSAGRNGLGAYTVAGTRNVLPDGNFDEFENTNGDMNYILRDYSEVSSESGPFDDLLVYYSAQELLQNAHETGSIKTPREIVMEDLDSIRDELIGLAISNKRLIIDGTCPNTSQYTYEGIITDAEGNPLTVTYPDGTVVTQPIKIPFRKIDCYEYPIERPVSVTDPWGRDYRIDINPDPLNVSEITNQGVVVIRSPGEDGTYENEDDIALTISALELKGTLEKFGF